MAYTTAEHRLTDNMSCGACGILGPSGKNWHKCQFISYSLTLYAICRIRQKLEPPGCIYCSEMASRRQSVKYNQFGSVLLNLPAKMYLKVELANYDLLFCILFNNGLQLREKSTVSPIPDCTISLVIQQELLTFRPVTLRIVESIND